MATDVSDSNEGWLYKTGIMLPPKMLANIRADSASDEEFDARVKAVKDSDAGRMGGFAEVKIKYRVTMPDKKEVTDG